MTDATRDEAPTRSCLHLDRGVLVRSRPKPSLDALIDVAIRAVKQLLRPLSQTRMEYDGEYWSDEPEVTRRLSHALMLLIRNRFFQPELEMALRMSREEYENSRGASTSTLAASSAGSSRLASQSSTKTRTSITRRADIEQRIYAVNAEIAECENRIAREQARRRTLQQELALLHTQMSQNGPVPSTGKGKGRQRTINYCDRFEWSDRLIACAQEKFGIEKFRLCQEGWVSLSYLALYARVMH